jgi:hypothetical protein
MRRSAIFSVALLALVVAARAQQEHGEHDAHGHHSIAHKLATGVKLEAKDDAAAESVLLRIGPMNLPARTDHMAMAQPPTEYWVVPFDGWLVGYHPRLVDAVGSVTPGRLLHHVAFWNTQRSDFLCPNKEEHIFGAGGEMNDWPPVPGYGYRVLKGERIRIETMVHNPTDTGYPQAYLEVRIDYRIRGAATSSIKSVYPMWLDVMQCGHSGYDLKPGPSATTGEVAVKYSGMLLGVGGHMHDYGQRLVLENETRKEEVAALDSKLDPAGRILSMPVRIFFDRGGYRINSGERFRITATYENAAGKPLPEGAMGIVVGYFAPDDDSQMAALQRPPRAARTEAKAE